MPSIRLIPIHGYTDARFLVKYEGIHGSQPNDQLIGTIAVLTEVRDDQNTVVYAARTVRDIRVAGSRVHHKDYKPLVNQIYTFEPQNGNPVQWGPTNSNPPRIAAPNNALTEAEVTLVFEPREGSEDYAEKKLRIPVSGDWLAEIDVHGSLHRFGRRSRGL